jgi:two-component system chemotaxis response regulator CheY
MPKILVVDDAAFMRMKCARLLTENGYEVIEAGTGSEAVETYKAQKPDGVLMDITMPDMDGLTALKQLRQADPNARVAMVTAMGQAGHRARRPQERGAGLCGEALCRRPGAGGGAKDLELGPGDPHGTRQAGAPPHR